MQAERQQIILPTEEAQIGPNRPGWRFSSVEFVGTVSRKTLSNQGEFKSHKVFQFFELHRLTDL
jgi:hypothetical protein